MKICLLTSLTTILATSLPLKITKTPCTLADILDPNFDISRKRKSSQSSDIEELFPLAKIPNIEQFIESNSDKQDAVLSSDKPLSSQETYNPASNPFESPKFKTFLENFNFIMDNVLILLDLQKICLRADKKKRKGSADSLYSQLFNGKQNPTLDSIYSNFIRMNPDYFNFFFQKRNIKPEDRLDDLKAIILESSSRLIQILEMAGDILSRSVMFKLYFPNFQYINYEGRETSSDFLIKALMILCKEIIKSEALADFCWTRNFDANPQFMIDKKYFIDFTVMIYFIFVKSPSLQEYNNIENHFENFRALFSDEIGQKNKQLNELVRRYLIKYTNPQDENMPQLFMEEICNIIRNKICKNADASIKTIDNAN